MPIDTALMGALHVEYLRERDLSGDEHLHHTLFQTSTVDALLEGKYEGDVSFAELGDRGDFGLGTFDALDGEMICLDGTFFQVKADGRSLRCRRTGQDSLRRGDPIRAGYIPSASHADGLRGSL